jgi:hypothetical protein
VDAILIDGGSLLQLELNFCNTPLTKLDENLN